MSENEFIQLPLDFEVWKPIPGYEGLYEVSDQGRVKRLPREGDAWRRHELIIRPGGGRYACVILKRNGEARGATVHRLVMLAFVGPRPPKYDVNHKNGQKKDNRLENLEYVTRGQNHQHRYHVLGQVAAHGEKHCRAKLTERDVTNIRALIGTMSYRAIAKQHGVSYSAIYFIANRINWKQLK